MRFMLEYKKDYLIMSSIKISLAGDLGSGKSTVGKILAERENLQFYSTGTIQRNIAAQYGMTTYELNKYMETHPEIDDEIDNGLRNLEKTDNNVIIDSRMAWHFVPSSFSVYMTTDILVSAKRIMDAKRDSEPFSSIEEAVNSLKARRASESKRYLELYGVDIKDMNNYKFVIDTSIRTPDEVANEILHHYRLWKEGKPFPHTLDK